LCRVKGYFPDILVPKGRAALDNNALVAAIEKGEAAAVDAALAGRTPVVSRQAVREFLTRGDKQALREYLSVRGGNVAKSGTQVDIAALQAQASSMGRSLKIKDARVTRSAQAEGVPLITRDRKLRNFMNASGLGGESF
jgi:predicted nucleic acid-binding protein